jgi:hypothetical protein
VLVVMVMMHLVLVVDMAVVHLVLGVDLGHLAVVVSVVQVEEVVILVVLQGVVEVVGSETVVPSLEEAEVGGTHGQATPGGLKMKAITDRRLLQENVSVHADKQSREINDSN